VREYICEKFQLAVSLCTLSIQMLVDEIYCLVWCDAVTLCDNSARRRHIPEDNVRTLLTLRPSMLFLYYGCI